MPPSPSLEGDILADISTKPIFDDAVYCSEALGLSHDQNEDDLENQLLVAAADAGIEDPYRYLNPADYGVSSAMSTMTLGSEQRSSMSIHSRETQSTSITSHQSRTSKDHTLGDISSALNTPPVAADSSSPDYVSVMDRFRPSIVHKHSSSSASHPASLLSVNSSLSKPASRKHKRASGLFAIFRKDSHCSSRSQRTHHIKPQSTKLECGHVLSKYAIRVHTEEALGKKDRVAPNCCGKPFSKSVLQTALTKEEVEYVSVTFSLPDSASEQDSSSSDDNTSSIDIPHTLTLRAQSESFAMPTLPSQPMTSVEEERLNSALANEAFKSLRAEEQAQFLRVSQFEANQRRALSTYYALLQAQFTARLEQSKDEKPKQHALELERLDEYQIVAEHDLRKAQAQETQNVATALKYMEAYCSGNKPTNPEITHIVTDEDRKKLARQHLMQQKLPAKHDSAINVLRARQEKDIKLKMQKQLAELRLLDTDYEKDKSAAEGQHLKDTTQLDTIIETRRQKLINRWDLKFEIWRRNWENQHGATLRGRLPHEDWPLPADPHAPLDATSSLAIYQATLA